MPSSSNTLATAPISESVLRVPSDKSTLASFQSGRMLENICLCLTCPAMIAVFTPSRLKVSISLLNSPSDIQCTDAAPRPSIRGEVSSLMAATTTSAPCARAASSSSKGKLPLPAINPSFCPFGPFSFAIILNNALQQASIAPQTHHNYLVNICFLI